MQPSRLSTTCSEPRRGERSLEGSPDGRRLVRQRHARRDPYTPVDSGESVSFPVPASSGSFRTPHLTKSLRWASPESPSRARHRGSRPANRPIVRPRAGLGWPTAIAGTADHCRKGLTPWKRPTRPDAARPGREEGSSRLGGLRHCWSLKHEYQSTRLRAEPVPVLQARPPSEHWVRIAVAAAHPMSCRRRQRPTRQP